MDVAVTACVNSCLFPTTPSVFHGCRNLDAARCRAHPFANPAASPHLRSGNWPEAVLPPRQ